MAYWEEEEQEEEDDENESYLASYSDLVTDLMAVFVILLSFALLAQGVRVRETAEKLATGMNAPVEEVGSGNGADVERFVARLEENIKLAGLEGELSINWDYLEDEDAQDMSSQTSLLGKIEPDTNIEKFIQELRAEIRKAGLEDKVSVHRNGRSRVLLRLMDSVLFDVGKADIKTEVKPLLEGIAEILSKYDDTIKYIHIEGHTDTTPIATAQFPSNWELSTGRAGSVVRYLIDKTTLKDEKFSSAGYGEFRPIADNATSEGRALNRRVEFSIELKEDDT